MEWTIEHLKEFGVIKTVVTGSVSKEELEALTLEQMALSKNLNVNLFLSVYRNVTQNISFSEINHIPDTLKSAGQTVKHKFAIVYQADSEFSDSFKFYETRCINTALNSRIFTDSDAALQWLLGDSG